MSRVPFVSGSSTSIVVVVAGTLIVGKLVVAASAGTVVSVEYPPPQEARTKPNTAAGSARAFGSGGYGQRWVMWSRQECWGL